MRKYILLCLFLSLFWGSQAQKTAYYDEPEATFRAAVELYSKGLYNNALKQFKWVEKRLAPDDTYEKSEIAYYKAMCAVRLYHRNADKMVRDYIEKYPDNPHLNQIYLEIGNLNYFKKNYSEAGKYYEKVDKVLLGEEDRYDLTFRQAYTFFCSNRYKKAKEYFSEILDMEGKYKKVVTYYYAYILYTEGKYQSAYDLFLSLRDDKDFGGIIPFYLLQIQYLQGEYENVKIEGEKLLEIASDKRKPEIARILGEAYYHTEEYLQSLPYMSLYFKTSSVSPDRNGLYILGYIYYRMDEIDSAIHMFNQVMATPVKDELAQNTLYHLGYLYTLKGEKVFAMKAFYSASTMKFNAQVREDALFNYAKLSQELKIGSYKETLGVLENFLKEYPNSVYQKQIYKFMLNTYATTKNYEQALASIRKIEHSDIQLKEIEQKLLFNRAVELFYQKDYEKAIVYFDQCTQNAYSLTMGTSAIFWKAQCYFKQGQFEESRRNLYAYLKNPDAVQTPEYPLAVYALGYAEMELLNYSGAEKAFENFLELAHGNEPKYEADARLRLGDVYFMLENYEKALSNYNTALEKKVQNADYAYYQKGLCLGAMGKYEDKVVLFTKFLQTFPSSPRQSAVMNELAETYLILENNAQAINYFNKLKKRYPNSLYAKSATLKLGLIYYNINKSDDALQMFKEVVEKYPNTEESKQALNSIKNIYINMNKVEAFFAYIQKNPDLNMEVNEQDSISYMAAENQYIEQHYQAAIEGFEQYFSRFSAGHFLPKAWYYTADSWMHLDSLEQALSAYEKVLTFPTFEYSLSALEKVAQLSYSMQDYGKAASYFGKLKEQLNDRQKYDWAAISELRSYYALSKYKEVLDLGLQYMQLDNANKDGMDEVQWMIARSAQKVGDMNLCIQYYGYLSSSLNSNYEAEAKTAIIENEIQNANYGQAEKLINEYVSDAPSNDYYLAKVYLLWAKIFEARGNLLQAKQTLQSIIENYDGEELKGEAEMRYQYIQEKEKQQKSKDEDTRKILYPEEDEIIISEM